MRKNQLSQIKEDRRRVMNDDNFLKDNREQMIENVCTIIYKHVYAAEKYIP
jgi:hypothetical protein